MVRIGNDVEKEWNGEKMDTFAKRLCSIYGPDTPFSAVFGEQWMA